MRIFSSYVVTHSKMFKVFADNSRVPFFLIQSVFANSFKGITRKNLVTLQDYLQ